MPDTEPHREVSRRGFLARGVVAGAVLAGSGLVVGGTTFTRATTAHPKPETHDVVWGDDIDYLDGVVRTYATTNPQGNLSSLGVYIDADAMAAFDEDELGAHLHLPEGVATHQFTFLAFHYNPEGHPPPDVYTVPHFDLHFYTVPESTVEPITTGPATYALPDAQIPSGYQRIPLVDTDGDGEPDAPLVEEEMGEHLVDPSGPEFQADGEFTHTMVYGAYDVDGSGTGRLTFLEPMVTNEFLGGLTEPVRNEFETPSVYPTADEYPAEYVMRPSLTGGVFVSLDGFTAFEGADE
ncbi:hypothetical protein [Haloarcula marina]|uniref:hypothetical protein n=1 Tax=Haloarcula marina TaxID=2961574 RepID=UPI0020B77B33|nr:hypothetical protein [Halomicroarcula marina]